MSGARLTLLGRAGQNQRRELMLNAYAGGGGDFQQAQVKIIEQRNWIDRLIEFAQDPFHAVLLLLGLVFVAFIVWMWRTA